MSVDDSEAGFCFDAANGHRLVERSVLQRQGRLADAVLSPSIKTCNESESLIQLLPDHVAQELAGCDKTKLTEIVMDVGRKPLAWIDGERHFLGDSTVTKEQIIGIAEQLDFGSDNRAGIDGSLHRISANRRRDGDVAGLTLRVGRFVPGNSTMIADVLFGSDLSILFLGPPGSGKTSIVRDAARVLAEKNSVVVVDTSCEIGGAGMVPHECIGLARRMEVNHIDEQAKTMIEAVQNHTPSCMIIDEIGRRNEVLAALTCKERGVRMIASAHGDLPGLVRNSALSDLVGGVGTVTVGDVTARREAWRKGTELHNKLQSQRKGPPIFDVVIELKCGKLHEWQVVFPCATAVDSILANGFYNAQLRSRKDSKESYICLRNVAVSEDANGGQVIYEAAKQAPTTGVFVHGIKSGHPSVDATSSEEGEDEHLDGEGDHVRFEAERLEEDKDQNGIVEVYSDNELRAMDLSDLSYRALQVNLKWRGEKAGGKAVILQERMRALLEQRQERAPLEQRQESKTDKTCPACKKKFGSRRVMAEHALHKVSCRNQLDEEVAAQFHREFWG